MVDTTCKNFGRTPVLEGVEKLRLPIHKYTLFFRSIVDDSVVTLT